MEHSLDDFVEAVESASGECVNGISPGSCWECEQCRDAYGYETEQEMEAAWHAGKICEEPHFSWHPCECCGSLLGGDRHEAHGLVYSDGIAEVCHLDICTDCVLYLANGDLPETWEG